ncbi:MAG: hypothetical protein ACI33I_04305 [Clostridium sp.]
MFKDIFKEMFDFNHDGKMDDFEKSAAFATFMSMLEEENKNKIKKSDIYSSDGESEDIEAELEAEGLDYDELSLMDEDERNEILEDCGLDPDDYDF